LSGLGEQGLGLGLEGGAAVRFHLLGPLGQAAEEVGHLLLDFRFGAQAGVGGDLPARPIPNRLVGVEIRAVGGQGGEPQIQPGRGELLADRVAPMGRPVVPDHDQRARAVGARLGQEGGAGLGVAVTTRMASRYRPSVDGERGTTNVIITYARHGGPDRPSRLRPIRIAYAAIGILTADEILDSDHCRR
jgi:hypothetical protein